MLRSMMQAYLVGSDKAVELYKRAFDAKVVSAYPNEDGTYCHVELDVYGQILAIAEASSGMDVPGADGKYAVSFAPDAERNPGNTMQFCLHFGPGHADKVRKAYEVLREDAVILYPMGPVSFSPCMFGLVDKFGVNWCVFE